MFAGTGKFCNVSGPLAVPTEAVKWLELAHPTEASNRSLILFDSGESVEVQAGDEAIRFLPVSGQPLQEPVAWYAPIVMNTQEQLRQAFEELRKGNFPKSANSGETTRSSRGTSRLTTAIISKSSRARENMRPEENTSTSSTAT